jgi:membrane-bound lytic murein transglycosylase D
MLRPHIGQAGSVIALAVFSAACATKVPVVETKLSTPVQTVAMPPPVVPAPLPPPLRDPVADLLAESTRHFETAQRELQEGHLEAARREFDRALEVLLESPDGARTEPRLMEHFDRLVERISAFEVTALAQGDGFAEKNAEPASIDELLTISTFAQPVATAETTEAVVEDLETTTHDIDIPLNQRVLSFVELFSGRLRSYLEEGLNRGAQYLPMIQRVFKEEGLPLDLAYVPLVESAFKVNAVSRAKARGMWQFMRGTALENGLKQDWYIDERADPEKATRAAARYLKTLYGMFGDWHLALASYNGGPGRVQRAMKRSGRGDFWKLSATTAYLPRETRDYVPLILAAVIVARNPAQYGIAVAPPEPRRVERVALSDPLDLRRVAEWIGIPVQTIQELNPELRRWTTPVAATDYELKVPEGAADVVLARLSETDPADLAPLNRYTVKKGETLLSVAKKLKVSRTDLAEANYLKATAKLAIGQQLVIPRAPALLLAARTDTPAPPAASKPAEAVLASNTPTSAAPAPERTADATVVHRVKSGETLFSIARLYRTTVASVKQWNRLSSNTIRAGQRLTIRTTRTIATN